MARILRIDFFILVLINLMIQVYSRNYKIVQNGKIQTISGVCNFTNFKFSETSQKLSFSGEFVFEESIPEFAMIDIFALEKRRNGYQKHMFFQKRNLAICPFFKTPQYQELARDNNWPLSCPIIANKYKLPHILLDTSFLPSYIPGSDKWAAEIILKFGKKELCKNRLFLIFEKIQQND